MWGPPAALQTSLTHPEAFGNLIAVTLTIDIPDRLAEQLGSERERVTQIIARGLRRDWSGSSPLRREVITFLARRPTTEQLIGFRPSEAAAARLEELLKKDKENRLASEEEAELDEMCEIDRFVSLIKTEVLRQTSGKE